MTKKELTKQATERYGNLTKKNASVVIYFFGSGRDGLEEGTIYLRKKVGTRYKVDDSVPEGHFDHIDDIPDKLRQLFRRRYRKQSKRTLGK